MRKSLTILSVLVCTWMGAGAADAAVYEVVAAGRDNRLHKFDSNGVEIASFKNNFQAYFTANSLPLPTLWGVAFDPANYQMWVSTFSGPTLYRVNADGTVAGAVTLAGFGSPSVDFTRGIDVGADGNLYVVTDDNGGQIWSVNTTNNAVSLINNSVPGNPYDVAYGPDGNLHVAMWNSANGIARYSAGGVFQANEVPHSADYATPPQVDRPYAVDFGPDGNLYVLDGDQFFPTATPPASMDFLVKRFDLTPTLSAVSPDWVVDGANDSNAATSRIHFGMAVAPDGRTFVSSYNPDSQYPDLAVFTPSGVGSTFINYGESPGSSVLYVHLDVLVIPEPASLALIGVGGVLMLRRRARGCGA